MRFRTIRLHELADYLESAEFRDSVVLPITRHRGQSYLRNPRAQPHDAVLFLAYLENRLAAYLGIFPDRIYLAEESFRAGWLSCMWVDPVCRGKGVAKRFMEMAFDAWGGHLLVTEFTPAAKGLYDRTGRFMDLHRSEGLRAYLRSDLKEIIPRKYPRLNWLRLPLAALDQGINLITGPKRNRWLRRPSEFKLERLESLNEEVGRFIESRQGNNLERRGPVELNWVQSYPWVLQGPPDDQARRYHFTSVADRFAMDQGLLRRADSSIAAFFCTSTRDGLMKVPYFFADEDALDAAQSVLVKQMLSTACHTLLVFHPALVQSLKKAGTPFLHLRPAVRNYIISKDLEQALASCRGISIQDGDADAAFT